MIPAGITAKNDPSIEALLVPASNVEEAAIAADGLPVYPITTLRDAVDYFSDDFNELPYVRSLNDFATIDDVVMSRDFEDVKGQTVAKRALEVAAAGGHNLLMIGAPGTGKSMLAKRVPSILPPLEVGEALESSKIHSVMWLLPTETPFLKERPYRAPHHTISDAGLLGGQTVPTPGEITLAHNGVLFLDELPEFKRNVLEVLRQPLENGEVTISRAAGTFTFPASFMMIAAMNPCACGYYGSRQHDCKCSHHQVKRYRSRISGPLLDRIDIHVELTPLSDDELLSAPTGEKSCEIRKRVINAREVQQKRFKGLNLYNNAQMEPAQIQEFCKLDTESQSYLRRSIHELKLSARAYDRILRVARTIADLENSQNIAPQHICEAVQYRNLNKRLL